MKSGENLYIWQDKSFPIWRYSLLRLSGLLAEICRAQGILFGRLYELGVTTRDQIKLATLTEDVVKTSEIEGEMLNVESVRSSVARRLGVEIGAVAAVDRHVEGVVEMVLDATLNANAPLSAKRLFGWHAALFPTGYSGMEKIRVGKWRNDTQGVMQVISGAITRRKVHFQAPPADVLSAEMKRFFAWANEDSGESPLIKAGLAHLWFVTLHPFDDGNGRIARAISDLFLTRAEGSPQRFYSMSAQIERERKHYYAALEHAQKGTLDVTDWLLWFLGALSRATAHAQTTLDTVLSKARFWQQWAETPMNARQIKILNALLDGFQGKLTSSKWAAIAKCSPDTALRDITQLIELGALKKSPSGGRSTAYEINL